MCYVMHIGAVEALRLCANEYQVETYLKKVVPERRIGTLSYSDPETGSHFWYPMASGRDAGRGRLHGHQEGVVDDVGRVRRLLRLPDDVARLQGVLRPVGLGLQRRGRRGEAGRVGRARPARQPVRLAADRQQVHARQPPRRQGRRRRVVERRGGRPVLPGRLVRLLERHLAGHDRHRHPPHDPPHPQGRRPARLRLPDHPGRGRRGDHRHQRRALHELLHRARAGRGHRRRPEGAGVGRVRPRRLPAVAVAAQVRGRQERRVRRRQDAALHRRLRASRRSRCSSSATCATARPAG